jgi:hypothetical protein
LQAILDGDRDKLCVILDGRDFQAQPRRLISAGEKARSWHRRQVRRC